MLSLCPLNGSFFADRKCTIKSSYLGLPGKVQNTDSVLAAFAMKVFILVIAVHCALFFRGAYLLDESFDEIQREEDKLPHYLKDDGIRRVAKLTKDHFNKTLKASRMLVVLFYYSSKDNQESESSWKMDEKMLEVGYLIDGIRAS